MTIIFNFCILTLFFLSRCDLITRCWAQEPQNRPTFFYIQDKLQEIRHSPLCFNHCLEDKEAATGIINQAFEGKSGQHLLSSQPQPHKLQQNVIQQFFSLVTTANSLPIDWEQKRLTSLIMNL